MPTYRLAIFASGSGSNAEVIARYFNGHPDIACVLIVSNKSDAYVLERARQLNIPSFVCPKNEFQDGKELMEVLRSYNVTHVVLAGFLLLIPQYLIQAFPDRIVNIHPALLPKYGGKGMYGMRVHQSVKAAGEKESGITIHLVNEHYDEGEIVFQARCEVRPEDTPEQIAQSVQKLEHEHYPRVIEAWVKRS